MQIFVRLLDGKARVLHVPPCASVEDLQRLVQTASGMPCDEQRLVCGSRQLQPGRLLSEEQVYPGTNITLLMRLRGGRKVVQMTVQPRIQKEKWSLYWKESMSTKTISLEPLQLELDASITIAEVLQHVAKTCGWDPVDGLKRLEGFTETWERAIYRGRELKAEATLEAAGLTDKATITTVRKVLVPEGWKVIKEGEPESLSSTDTEDDF